MDHHYVPHEEVFKNRWVTARLLHETLNICTSTDPYVLTGDFLADYITPDETQIAVWGKPGSRMVPVYV